MAVAAYIAEICGGIGYGSYIGICRQIPDSVLIKGDISSLCLIVLIDSAGETGLSAKV